jgi:ATP-dependent Clp protease adapter protein ClpS
MKLSALIETLDWRVVVPPASDADITAAYTSDLLSDMMGNAEDGAVLITMQAHKNTIAVAAQLDAPAVILCNKRQLSQELMDAATAAGVGVLQTDDNQFIVSGRLYALLHNPG